MPLVLLTGFITTLGHPGGLAGYPEAQVVLFPLAGHV
jgi:hypothetical protein